MKSETPIQFAKRLVAFGEQTLKLCGSIEPMFVGELPDGNEIAIAAVINDDNKTRVLADISRSLKERQVERYGFVIESWYVDYAERENPYAVRPSKSERRKEAVTVSVCTKEGVEAFIMQAIERDDKGNPVMGKVLSTSDKDPLDPRTGGTFSELLQ